MSKDLKLDLTPVAPRAASRPHSIEHHGHTLVDPWHWLRDDTRKDEQVLDYLKQENAYTEAVLRPLDGSIEGLFKEMVARIKEDDETVPIRWGGFVYYSRTETGKQYRIF